MTDTTNTTPALRFEIDQDLCSGHGRCYSLAPQWFDSDDVGYGVVKPGGVAVGERATMEDVANACPEGAIRILADSDNSADSADAS